MKTVTTHQINETHLGTDATPTQASRMAETPSSRNDHPYDHTMTYDIIKALLKARESARVAELDIRLAASAANQDSHDYLCLLLCDLTEPAAKLEQRLAQLCQYIHKEERTDPAAEASAAFRQRVGRAHRDISAETFRQASVRIPIFTGDVAKWAKEMEAAGLAYHIDDDPEDIVNAEGRRTFTNAEAATVSAIVDAFTPAERELYFSTVVGTIIEQDGTGAEGFGAVMAFAESVQVPKPTPPGAWPGLVGHVCGWESETGRSCNVWLYPEGHPRHLAEHEHTFTCGKKIVHNGRVTTDTCDQNEGHEGPCTAIPF